ncbi:MAG: TetR/AcrR family transcriptional regulator [Lachnospiraceae bacterium]|jgi:AcrR family transcriptional regulator|nr:TetR/AcrR family transcriptional regulator [Lachnospiraceae bacterium]
MKQQRISRSRRDMRNALLQLMKTTPYGAITVTMLAGEAGVNRKTFYAHYQNKDELLHELLYDMFDELFGCFMYEKGTPDEILDEEHLRSDVRRFLETLERSEEKILVLITSDTSETAIAMADQVVLNRLKEIHVLEDGGTVPRKFYLEIIRNFFMGLIDAWLEAEGITQEEGVTALTRLIRHSFANMFRYVRPERKQTQESALKTPRG